MDGPGAPDRVWRSIKDLAAEYSHLPAPPLVDQMERDLQKIIHENLGRDIDRRLIAFYVRELQQLTDEARRVRNVRGELAPDKSSTQANKPR